MRNKCVKFFLQEYETVNMSDIKLCQNMSIENVGRILCQQKIIQT